MNVGKARAMIFKTDFQEKLDEILENHTIESFKTPDEDYDEAIIMQSIHQKTMEKIIELTAETYSKIA